MKLFKILMIAVLLSLPMTAISQENAPKQEVQTIQPTFVAGDIVFAIRALNTIQIEGKEVDVFLAVKSQFEKIIKEAETKKLTTTDTIKAEITVPVAQATINLLQRAKLTGAAAVQFKRFVNSMVDAAKALQAKKK